MLKLNYKIDDFILPAFVNKEKYTTIPAGRQTGKTFNTIIWLNNALLRKKSFGLWVDTTQSNLDKYIDRDFTRILGDIWKMCRYDRQKHILYYPNGSILDMGSAERPELLEGFGYDYTILNEAGIILKKQGLWENTIEPMTKNAKVKIIGTPKGEVSKYFELTQYAKNYKDWANFHYTCYDSPHWRKEDLEEKKARLPHYIFCQEYLGEFTSGEGGLIKSEQVKFFSHTKEIKEAYIHIDTTHTGKKESDYFCICLVGKCTDNYYNVLDFVLTKAGPEKQVALITTFWQKWQHLPIRQMTFDAVSNDGFKNLFHTITRQQDLNIPLTPKKYYNDKINHLTSHFDKFASGAVRMPENHPENQLAINQLLSFPNKSINDDFVDALTGALDGFTSAPLTKEELTERFRQAKLQTQEYLKQIRK